MLRVFFIIFLVVARVPRRLPLHAFVRRDNSHAYQVKWLLEWIRVLAEQVTRVESQLILAEGDTFRLLSLLSRHGTLWFYICCRFDRTGDDCLGDQAGASSIEILFTVVIGRWLPVGHRH